LLSITNLTVEVSPAILTHVFPRDQPGHLAERAVVPVTIAGSLNEESTSRPTVRFQVIDSYGLDEPSGTILTQPKAPGPGPFFYNTRIGLSIRRHRNDPNRDYTIVATAQDAQGTQTAETVAILYPRNHPLNRSH
jgi:hypothetical protein